MLRRLSFVEFFPFPYCGASTRFRVMAFPYGALWSHSVRHTKLGRTPLDKWWARHRDLYLTTHAITETKIHALVGFRTCNPSKREAARPRLRSLGHRDRPFVKILCLKSLHLAARKLKRLLCSYERCICQTRTLRETELFPWKHIQHTREKYFAVFTYFEIIPFWYFKQEGLLLFWRGT